MYHTDFTAVTYTAADIDRIMRDARQLRAQTVRDSAARALRFLREALSANARLPGVWPHPGVERAA